MKRGILCPNCHKLALHSAGIQITAAPGEATDRLLEGMVRRIVTPPEQTKYVTGTLHHACYCDLCDKPMSKGDYAVARSIWSDAGGVHYFEWESEYL